MILCGTKAASITSKNQSHTRGDVAVSLRVQSDIAAAPHNTCSHRRELEINTVVGTGSNISRRSITGGSVIRSDAPLASFSQRAGKVGKR